MKRANLILQIALLAEGVLLILRTPQLVSWVNETISTPEFEIFGTLWRAYSDRLDWAIPILGITVIICAWALISERPWARRSAYGVSMIHTALFPFLTPLGLFGLFVLLKTRNRIELQERMFWSKREVQKANLPWAYRAVSFSVIVAAGAVVYAMVRSAQTARMPIMPVWLLPFALLGSVVLVSLVHEIGHVIAGTIVKFQVSHLSIGPFWFGRFPAGWRARFISDLSWAAAFSAARPRTLDNIRQRVIIFLAGGSAASLAFGILSVAAFLSTSGVTGDIFGLFAVVAFVDCLTELSLVRKGHALTDGAKIVKLWENTREAEQILAIYVLGLSETTPVRPQNWKESWVMQATSEPDASTYFVGCYYAYIYHLDREDSKAAGEWLDRILEWEADKADGVRRWKASVEGAYFEAVHRCAPSRARYWLGQPRQGIAADPVAELRAEAAVLYAENQMSEAGGVIIRARQLLSAYPETGLTAFESQLLDDLNRRILAVRPATLTLRQLSLVVDKDKGPTPSKIVPIRPSSSPSPSPPSPSSSGPQGPQAS